MSGIIDDTRAKINAQVNNTRISETRETGGVDSAIRVPGTSGTAGQPSGKGILTNPETGEVYSPQFGTDSGDHSTSTNGTAPSFSDNWEGAADWYNMPGWGRSAISAISPIPFTNQIIDYGYGFNPTPGAGNYVPGTDTYIPTFLERYEGPGDRGTDDLGLTNSSEQRDHIIEQELGEKGENHSIWDSSGEEAAWSNNHDSYDSDSSWDGGTADDPGGDDDDAGGWSFSDDSGGDSGGGDSGGGGSYIATATTEAVGDNCIREFDNWRDHMAELLPTFKTTYGRYRVTAPKIVKAIDAKDNSKEIYQGIWEGYLKGIRGMFRAGDDAGALGLYRVMVKNLKEKYYDKRTT